MRRTRRWGGPGRSGFWSFLVGLADVEHVDAVVLPGVEQFVAVGLGPGGDVGQRATVGGEDLEYLVGLQPPPGLGRGHDRHRAHQVAGVDELVLGDLLHGWSTSGQTNRVTCARRARAMKAAAPATSTVIWQAMSRTSASWAVARSSPMVATCFLANLDRIIADAIGTIPGSDEMMSGMRTGIGIAGLPTGSILSLRAASLWMMFRP